MLIKAKFLDFANYQTWEKIGLYIEVQCCIDVNKHQAKKKFKF